MPNVQMCGSFAAEETPGHRYRSLLHANSISLSALIIFIQHPERGAVRPELAGILGEDAALQIHQHLLARTRNVTAHFDGEKFLFYTGYPNWNDAWDIGIYRKRVSQGADDAEQLQNALEVVYEEGHDSALVIGADTYDLTPEILHKAADALAERDVIVGPAHDGGCYLLGLKKSHSALFSGMGREQGGTPEQAIMIAEKNGLRSYLLPVLHNLNNIADLQQSGLKYD